MYGYLDWGGELWLRFLCFSFKYNFNKITAVVAGKWQVFQFFLFAIFCLPK